ncbi:MAG: hypothetical protein KCHDKBKB_01813 [Elusimicrobia bacterium]|nr:hypothetical protein [Elusimicrobiota bacterium]
MKLLFISHSFPFPIHEGIRLHVYHLLKNFSKRCDVHLLCFIFSEEEKKFFDEIKPFCKSLTMVLHPVPKGPLRRIFNTLFSLNPFCLYQFNSEGMASAVQRLIREIEPDVVHFDHTPMAQYAPLVPLGTPKIFFPHDALSMLFERNYLYEKNLARKFYFWAQFRKIRRYERKMLPQFDKTVVVSPVDQAVMQKIAPAASIGWSPNGVDMDYFAAAPEQEMENIVVFRGIMDFFPNHDAAAYFAGSVMPLVWQKNPQAEFWIVGHNPFPALKQMAAREPRIKILGFVGDIRVPMAKATVIVCPMRTGSGIKNKILESFAMAKPVVATTLSLAGIDAHPGQQVMLGDDAAALAQHTLDLLANRELRKNLGRSGQELVKSHYRWELNAAYFYQTYKDAIKKRGRSS